MHNRIHNLVIDLAVHAAYMYVSGAMGDGTPSVCAEFFGLAIGTERLGMEISW